MKWIYFVSPCYKTLLLGSIQISLLSLYLQFAGKFGICNRWNPCKPITNQILMGSIQPAEICNKCFLQSTVFSQLNVPRLMFLPGEVAAYQISEGWKCCDVIGQRLLWPQINASASWGQITRILWKCKAA